MRERGLEYKVGLLIVVSTSILVGFLFILGNYSLRSGFTIHVDYNYVGSLQAGAPIKLSGIKVGKVKTGSSIRQARCMFALTRNL